MARSGKGGGMSAMIQRPTPGFQGSVFNRGQQPFVVQGTPAGQAGVASPVTNTPPWQPQAQVPSVNVASRRLPGLFADGPRPGTAGGSFHGAPMTGFQMDPQTRARYAATPAPPPNLFRMLGIDPNSQQYRDALARQQQNPNEMMTTQGRPWVGSGGFASTIRNQPAIIRLPPQWANQVRGLFG